MVHVSFQSDGTLFKTGHMVSLLKMSISLLERYSILALIELSKNDGTQCCLRFD